MQRNGLRALAMVVAFSLPVVMPSPVAASSDPYIVIFDDGDTSRGVDRGRVTRKVVDLQNRHGLEVSNVFTTVGGFSARLTQEQRRALKADPSIAHVVPDVVISLDEIFGDDGIAAQVATLAAPSIPAGIMRVGARQSPAASTSINGADPRVDVDVAILDTGVDASHPDLNVVGGYNCTGSDRNAWADIHGHGTHVAGTLGALDNDIGVVGVAPGARIWGIKVLNDKGTGQASWLVCGIDWVTAQKDAAAPSGQRIEVANMSLRFSLANADDTDCGNPSGDAVHKAICRSVDAGVVYAVAAGNDRKDARNYRPAAYDEVITVSAMVDYDGLPGGLANQADYCSFQPADTDDTFADFSNFGADIDLIAPGKCVLSTYPGNRYAYMSGTSMATPHVAGGAALYLSTYRNMRPAQVRKALQDAGTFDWDTSTDPDGKPDRLLWLASVAPGAAPPSHELVPIPVTVTARPSRVTVLKGSYRKGNAASLTANDGNLYVVDSTTSGTRVAAWYGSFANVARDLTSLSITYRGSNTASATQTVSVYRWTDNTWVRLSSRTVGTTEVKIANLSPPGNLAGYVSGSGSLGEVRVRIRSVRSASFRSRGEVMKLVYTDP
jgi:subtilisin